MSMMNRTLAAVASVALLGACNDNPTVVDLNNISAETIKGGLTTASAQLLTTGLLNQYRGSAIGTWITFPETMARDAMRLDKAESRYVSEIIGGTAPDYSAFTGGGAFTGFFVGIRTANTLIDAAKAADASSGMSTAELSSLVGLGQTMKALNYWNVMETRDTIGMPIDLDHPITEPPAKWCDKASVYAYISALLDSANTALQAGAAAFPVTLPSGYRAVAGTPAGFAKFNRGLKAKVELYRGIMGNAGSLAAALTAINASFMQTTDLSAAGLALGVNENYSTASGEVSNGLVDNALHLNAAVVDSMQSGDLRGSKIVTVANPYTLTVSSTTLSTRYDYSATLTQPLPILKNEELLLLRAQIAIEQNDLATATTFLNYVRQNSGGLGAYALFTTQAAARNALLYEKRYSLLMEGPQRLVDLRAYGRLNVAAGPTYWPKGASASSPFSTDIYTNVLPIPLNEVSVRGGTPPAPAACQ